MHSRQALTLFEGIFFSCSQDRIERHNMGEGALPSFLQREELKDQNNDVPVAFLVISTLVVIGAVAYAVRYLHREQAEDAQRKNDQVPPRPCKLEPTSMPLGRRLKRELRRKPRRARNSPQMTWLRMMTPRLPSRQSSKPAVSCSG